MFNHDQWVLAHIENQLIPKGGEVNFWHEIEVWPVVAICALGQLVENKERQYVFAFRENVLVFFDNWT